MNTGIGRVMMLGLGLAASGLVLAGDRGEYPQRAVPPDRMALPELPPGTLPPAALPPLRRTSHPPDPALPELPPGTLPPVSLPADRAGSPPAGAGAKGDVTVPGTIRPASEVNVTPLVSGQVAKVLVEEGDVVKAGQVLATLDRTRAELELRKAEARLDRAKAALDEAKSGVGLREGEVKKAEAAVKQAEAQRSYARKKLERLRALLERQAIDTSVVDEAEALVQAAEAQVEQASAGLLAGRAALDKEQARVMAAKADVAVAQADRDLAKWNVDAAEVRAPAAGTVLARHVKVGDGVGPAQANGRPTPLFELADLTRLEAVANVPEKAVVALKVGQKCEVRLDAIPGVVYAGKVSQVAPVVSPQNRTTTVRVKIEIAVGDSRLRPGMYGEVRILAKE